MAPPRNTPEMVWKHIDKRSDDECWEWTAGVSPNGYGNYSMGHKTHAAHRVVFELVNGPTDEFVLHTCDNRRCCNPAHLYAGDHQSNMDDRSKRGRTSGQRMTHCHKGHEFTEENTYRWGKNRRRCKACHRARAREHYQRSKKVVASV